MQLLVFKVADMLILLQSVSKTFTFTRIAHILSQVKTADGSLEFSLRNLKL